MMTANTNIRASALSSDHQARASLYRYLSTSAKAGEPFVTGLEQYLSIIGADSPIGQEIKSMIEYIIENYGKFSGANLAMRAYLPESEYLLIENSGGFSAGLQSAKAFELAAHMVEFSNEQPATVNSDDLPVPRIEVFQHYVYNGTYAQEKSLLWYGQMVGVDGSVWPFDNSEWCGHEDRSFADSHARRWAAFTGWPLIDRGHELISIEDREAIFGTAAETDNFSNNLHTGMHP